MFIMAIPLIWKHRICIGTGPLSPGDMKSSFSYLRAAVLNGWLSRGDDPPRPDGIASLIFSTSDFTLYCGQGPVRTDLIQ